VARAEKTYVRIRIDPVTDIADTIQTGKITLAV
jgi:hypothetical protein